MFSQNNLTQNISYEERLEKNISVSFCSSTIKALEGGYHRKFVQKDEVCLLLLSSCLQRYSKSFAESEIRFFSRLELIP